LNGETFIVLVLLLPSQCELDVTLLWGLASSSPAHFNKSRGPVHARAYCEHPTIMTIPSTADLWRDRPNRPQYGRNTSVRPVIPKQV